MRNPATSESGPNYYLTSPAARSERNRHKQKHVCHELLHSMSTACWSVSTMQCDLHTLTKLSPTHHSRQHQSFTIHNNAFERSNLASMQETFAPGPTLVHPHFAVVQRCEDNPYSCLTNKWLQFGLSRAPQPRCGREPHTPSTYARAAITLSSVRGTFSRAVRLTALCSSFDLAPGTVGSTL